MATAIKPVYSFSNKEEMISYLEQHHKLASPYFREGEVIQKIAGVFANTKKDSDELNKEIIICLYNIKSIKTPSQQTTHSLIDTLAAVLKDYTREKHLLRYQS